jgi:LmbE family N-acetylglucosaminyl deacetylase
MERLDEEWQTALAVVAHPDDLEYGVASAIARWTSQGKRVSYSMVTSGEAGIQGHVPVECALVREEEERRSAAVVGVQDVAFLGLPDGEVEYGLPLRRAIATEIRRVRPDVVITMNFELTWGGGAVNHADHRAVGLAVLDACRDAANEWSFRGAGRAWDGAHTVYVAAASEPTHYVDVTATIDQGVASLREHKAYIEGLGTDFDPDAFLRGFAASTGAEVGVAHAVSFRAYST